jgi:hypothetical protein
MSTFATRFVARCRFDGPVYLALSTPGLLWCASFKCLSATDLARWQLFRTVRISSAAMLVAGLIFVLIALFVRALSKREAGGTGAVIAVAVAALFVCCCCGLSPALLHLLSPPLC